MALDLRLEIGQRILETAKANEISDQGICRLLKANRNKVDDWKKGKSSPTIEEVSLLAHEFNVTTDYLLGKSDDPSPQILAVPKALRQVMVAFEDVEELSQKQVDKITEYTKFVLSQPD